VVAVPLVGGAALLLMFKKNWPGGALFQKVLDKLFVASWVVTRLIWLCVPQRASTRCPSLPDGPGRTACVRALPQPVPGRLPELHRRLPLPRTPRHLLGHALWADGAAGRLDVEFLRAPREAVSVAVRDGAGEGVGAERHTHMPAHIAELRCGPAITPTPTVATPRGPKEIVSACAGLWVSWGGRAARRDWRMRGNRTMEERCTRRHGGASTSAL
jgi:hypothetical protein